jgi:hypothetical protein
MVNAGAICLSTFGVIGNNLSTAMRLLIVGGASSAARSMKKSSDTPKIRPGDDHPGRCGAGYLVLLRACATSSSNALPSWLAAARAAARTNFVAFAGPAAL